MKRYLILAAVLAGCASPPQYIQPAYVSPLKFSPLACDQLAQEDQRTTAALKKASDEQKSAANTDAVGVFLIGVPIGSMAGHNATDQVSILKGEKTSINTAIAQKKCPIPPLPAPIRLDAAPPANTQQGNTHR